MFHTGGRRKRLRPLLPKPFGAEARRLREDLHRVVPSVAEPTSPVGSGSWLTLTTIEPQPWQFSALFVPPIEYGVPENAATMPFSCQPPSTVPAHALRVLQPRQRVHEAHLEDVRAVEARQREVLVVHHRMRVVETNPAVLVRHVLRLAQRVGALQEQALGERPVDGDLQAVIAALGPRRPVVDRRRAGQREELARRVAAARLAVVDVQVGVAAVGRGADIRELGRDVERPAGTRRRRSTAGSCRGPRRPDWASGRRCPAAASPGRS